MIHPGGPVEPVNTSACSHPAQATRRTVAGPLGSLVAVETNSRTTDTFSCIAPGLAEPGCLPGQAPCSAEPGCLPSQAPCSAEPGCLPGQAPCSAEPGCLPGVAPCNAVAGADPRNPPQARVARAKKLKTKRTINASVAMVDLRVAKDWDTRRKPKSFRHRMLHPWCLSGTCPQPPVASPSAEPKNYMILW
jgi:hypothetical protein